MFVYNQNRYSVLIKDSTMKDINKLSERQRNILRFMEKYIETYGFPPSIREIGEATGTNSTSVVNYNLNKLVQAGYLVRSSQKSRGLRLVKYLSNGEKQGKGVLVQPALSVLRVPMVGQIVASEPVQVPDDVGYYYDEDSAIEVTPSLLQGVDPAEVYALRVKGDSMIDAMIADGDVVLFRKQTTANNGDMVAVWLTERGETTLKRFFDEGTRIRLQPAHPTMKPIFVDPNHVTIQGKVLSVIRRA
jgi:repressor LexA